MPTQISAIYRQRQKIKIWGGEKVITDAVEAFEIRSLPVELDNKSIIESMLSNRFMMCHNLSERKTFFIGEKSSNIGILSKSVPGMTLEGLDFYMKPCEFVCLVVYNHVEDVAALDGLYKIFGGIDCKLFVSFSIADKGYVSSISKNVEHLLSKGEIRLTKSLGNGLAPASKGSSIHMDLYYNSDQRQMLTSMLNMLNQAMLANGNAYKVCLFVENNGNQQAIVDYIKSKLLVFEESIMHAESLHMLFANAMQKNTIPFSFERASTMIAFSNQVRRVVLVDTERFEGGKEVRIGTYLNDSIQNTGIEACLDKEVFNLGTLICGVPGTGKTGMAMNLVRGLRSANNKVVVISPTSEWEAFGISNNMQIIKLYSSHVLLNFFRCDANINIERFYENLSILLAGAVNAGPYTRSLQKCLLSAFSRVYAKTRSPDPVDVYEEIERVIIEQHGIASNTSIKYTKHGENIKAALEDLRVMLLKPQFAYENGIDLRNLIEQGVVFDLSEVSNSLKPFFYAMILNQVYSYADELDTKGERELRMVICMEESQLVFKGADRSAAMTDLEQRIQDFRKRGIGLVLLTHNVTDIDQGIRRLCQIKMYFRQSADVAKYAANDLIFSAEEDVIANKLKTLEHRVCAMNYVTVENGQKEPRGSVFVRTSELKLDKEVVGVAKIHVADKMIEPMLIKLTDSEGKPLQDKRIRVTFAGNVVFDGVTNSLGISIVEKALIGKTYRLFVFGEKKRDTKIFYIKGKENVLVI